MKSFKSPPIHRTPLYRAKASYRNMKRRCLNANGNSHTYTNVELKMTLPEFLEWAVPRYKDFMDKHPDGRPCTARFGDKGHYEIGNIEVIDFSENISKQEHKKTWKHGTLSGYRYCRCKECKNAQNIYSRNFKRKQRVNKSAGNSMVEG